MKGEGESKMRLMGLNFSPEIRLGEVIVSVGVIGGGLLWWGNFTAELAIIKHSQAAQVETNGRIEGNIREIKNDVKDTRDSVRGLERRMDRARM
jgi:hypothetical protein